ncbi:T6SS immunity protein Tdi1 domain-containing protein [Pseudovibrio sp. JE062]|uniref:T6SS immunity protein Tdi1 domain-containing protein n=1 Tax=Pseudovibrio sp. JE062 TaxID=439495 RepID=UPI000186BCC0|nr:T6SS immunity protein Tdi1 domain-containing protein [Pseudovibrio sp. JE062]EEA94872.1 conserved domain protein [Pseudovibrio sp. JE062]
MLSEDFESLFEDIDRPREFRKIQSSEAKSLKESVPDDLFEYFTVYGRSILFEGRYQTCHPDDMRGVLSLIFRADKDFTHKNCHAFLFSSFGEISFWHQEHGYGSVNLLSGEVICRSFTKKTVRGPGFLKTFIVGFASETFEYDFYDTNDRPLFSRARRKLGEIGIGECYGFVPALGLGGVPELETLKKLKAPEHFAILAQLIDFQLIDVQGYGKSVVVREIG